jgi:hypothetical protein
MTTQLGGQMAPSVCVRLERFEEPNVCVTALLAQAKRPLQGSSGLAYQYTQGKVLCPVQVMHLVSKTYRPAAALMLNKR